MMDGPLPVALMRPFNYTTYAVGVLLSAFLFSVFALGERKNGKQSGIHSGSWLLYSEFR